MNISIHEQFHSSYKIAQFKQSFQKYLQRLNVELISLKEINKQWTKSQLFQKIQKMQTIIISKLPLIVEGDNQIQQINSKQQFNMLNKTYQVTLRKFDKYLSFKLDLMKNAENDARMIEKSILDLINLKIYSAFYVEQIKNIKELYQQKKIDQCLKQCQDIQKILRQDLQKCSQLRNFYEDAQIIQVKCFYKMEKYQQAIDMYEKYGMDWYKADDYRLIYILGQSYFCINEQNQAARFFQRAIELNKTNYKPTEKLAIINFNKKQYQKAINYYDQALSINLNFKFFNAKGLCLLNLGQFENSLQKYKDSLQMWDRSIGIEPMHHEAYAYKGLTLYILRKFEDAIIYYDKAIKINPKDYQIYHDKGDALQQLLRFQEAILMYDKAINLNSNSLLSYLSKGISLHKVQHFDEAIMQYDQIIKSKTDNVNYYLDAYTNKGRALHQLKRFNEAIQMYDQAIQLNSKDEVTLFDKGLSLVELRKYEDAIICFDKAITLKNDYLFAISNKGNALKQLERFQEAILEYNKVIQLNPFDGVAYFNKGSALFELKKFDESIQSYNKAIENNFNIVDAYLNIGMALFELKKFEDSIKQYDHAIEINPNYEAAYFRKGNNFNQFQSILKGLSLGAIEKYEDAIQMYDKAIEINSNNFQYFYKKGVALFQQQNFQIAIKMFDKSLKINPDTAMAYFLIAKIYQYQGTEQQSVEYFEKAFQLNPKLREYQYSNMPDFRNI